MNEINFIIYQTPQGNVNIEAVVKDETLWLTQKARAELFGVQVPAISKHLKNIFEEGELAENMVVSKMEITTQHGAIEGKTQQKETNFYNLDAIISVGYRVNSAKATHFRSLPLHRSQKEEETAKDYSIFSYYVVPTYELRQEILSHGANVEVVSPKALREQIKEEIAEMHKLYK